MSRCPSAPSRAGSGFTLIEVLVAVSIMAIMAVLAWRGVDGIVRTKQATEARLERVLALNTALSQWAADLSAIQETPWVPPVGFDGNTLRITRQTPQGIQLVVWSVQDGLWFRWTSPPTTRRGELQDWWMRSQALESMRRDPRVESVAAVPGLTGWQVYYFRNNAWTHPQSSDADQARTPPEPPVGVPGGSDGPGGATPAPGRGQPTVPDGVRIVLGFAADPQTGAGPSGQVVRDIALRRRAGG